MSKSFFNGKLIYLELKDYSYILDRNKKRLIKLETGY